MGCWVLGAGCVLAGFAGISGLAVCSFLIRAIISSNLSLLGTAGVVAGICVKVSEVAEPLAGNVGAGASAGFVVCWGSLRV